jgi:hypothetical protein
MRGVPDPYEHDLRELRAAQGITIKSITDNDPRLTAMATRRNEFYSAVTTSRRTARVPARSEAHLVPPDPYAEALEKLKKGAR